MLPSTIFAALITFERTGAENDILPEEAQGACCFMAVKASDEDDLRNALAAELREIGLRLVAIDEAREIDIDDLPNGMDPHLVENINDWGDDTRTVWGTIHIYLADGEA